jgi:AraC-like DNA-binding protein
MEDWVMLKAANRQAADERTRAETARVALVEKISKRTHGEGDVETAIAGLRLYRRSVCTACVSAAYEPSLVVFVQGEKHINVGKTVYICDRTNFLLTAVDLPVMSKMVKATSEEPALCLILRLEMAMVREILSQQEFDGLREGRDARGMAMGVSSVELLDACCRLVDLLDAPQDIGFMSGLLQREILYRLLMSPQGRHLRAIATLGEQGQRLSKTVEWLRQNYAKPLRVEELAEMARMGVSTLHHQFRSLTAMSPLQYQKQVRLHVARERMVNEGIDAASAAFEVGYESASQFSREYRRFFGMPPMRDVKARLVGGEIGRE